MLKQRLNMQHLSNENIEKSELYDRAEKLKALFKTPQEALAFYSCELESLAKKCGVSVSELILKAENSPSDEMCTYALSLSRKIQTLKK
jgi:hypothetical protein